MWQKKNDDNIRAEYSSPESRFADKTCILRMQKKKKKKGFIITGAWVK